MNVSSVGEEANAARTEYEVPASLHGARLDAFLVSQLEEVGRAGAKRLIAEGKVVVNGRRAPKGYSVSEGDVVAIQGEAPVRTAVPDGTLDLELAFEDDCFVVVNKAVGVPTHPLAEGERGTVANALVHRFPEMATVGYDPREPGILHRLDVHTSGLLLAAKTTDAWSSLREMLTLGKIEKHYVALCGSRVPAPMDIRFPIANDPKNRRRVRVCFTDDEAQQFGAKAAETRVLSCAARGPFGLVEVSASIATRHQVRAHLAAEGYPLIGDRMYGGPDLDGLEHHLLHANRLCFEHPVSGEVIDVRTQIPTDWPT